MPEENWVAHGGVPACDLCHARKVGPVIHQPILLYSVDTYVHLPNATNTGQMRPPRAMLQLCRNERRMPP